MGRSRVRLTMAQALVRYLCNQFADIDGVRVPLFAGMSGIFGHGAVTRPSKALESVQDQLQTWRGQTEQSMAVAAIGFAKAKRRRQIKIATSSIGQGALNMVTAAGTAHANPLHVDFAAHAAVIGAASRKVGSLADLASAFDWRVATTEQR